MTARPVHTGDSEGILLPNLSKGCINRYLSHRCPSSVNDKYTDLHKTFTAAGGYSLFRCAWPWGLRVSPCRGRPRPCGMRLGPRRDRLRTFAAYRTFKTGTGAARMPPNDKRRSSSENRRSHAQGSLYSRQGLGAGGRGPGGDWDRRASARTPPHCPRATLIGGYRISEGDLLCKKRSRDAAAHLLPARPGAATLGDIRMEPTTRRRAAHWSFVLQICIPNA